MPHQCVNCNHIFADGSKEILEGCSECDGKFFFYIKKDRLEQAQQRANALSSEQKQQIERDVLELIGDSSHDKPVVLDLESINVLGPGQYELDLVNLFSEKQPLVYKLEDGKYVVDIIETFQRSKK
ncbi:MAG: Zn-ribbon domain-containing protein [Candidatus Woesearchaeota archaeon]